MIAVSDEPIDVALWTSRIDRNGAGSVVVHLGVVKPDPDGRATTGVSFCRRGDLEGELASVERAVRERLQVVDLVLVRRMGRLGVGDLILFVAASANDRENAFAACRELVERGKKLKCISKDEHWV
jgi:molybdopterin synthase catalytic subunit